MCERHANFFTNNRLLMTQLHAIQTIAKTCFMAVHWRKLMHSIVVSCEGASRHLARFPTGFGWQPLAWFLVPTTRGAMVLRPPALAHCLPWHHVKHEPNHRRLPLPCIPCKLPNG